MDEGGVEEEEEEISKNVANRVSMGGSSSCCCGDFITNVYPAYILYSSKSKTELTE